jgi:hypothetical protein
MIKLLGSASILAKYPPPSDNPANVEGTLATVDQSFLDRLAFKYVGQVRGSGLTGSFGVSLSEALADEVARDRITMPVDGAWRLRLASGRRAARDIVEYDYRWMIGKIG